MLTWLFTIGDVLSLQNEPRNLYKVFLFNNAPSLRPSPSYSPFFPPRPSDNSWPAMKMEEVRAGEITFEEEGSDWGCSRFLGAYLRVGIYYSLFEFSTFFGVFIFGIRLMNVFLDKNFIL